MQKSPTSALARASATASRGKAKTQLFPGKQPRLFSINHQSPKTRETRPKRPWAHVWGSDQRGERVSTPPAPNSAGHPEQVKETSRRALCGTSSNPADSRAPSPHTVRTKFWLACSPGPGESSNSPLPRPQQRKLPNGCVIAAHRNYQGRSGRVHLAVVQATPRGGQEVLARDKGVARAQGGAPGSPAGRDSPSQRPGCAPRGAEGLRAAAAARRRARAPWWRARGGGNRRVAVGDGGRALGGRGGRITLGGPGRERGAPSGTRRLAAET